MQPSNVAEACDTYTFLGNQVLVIYPVRYEYDNALRYYFLVPPPFLMFPIPM